MKRILGLTLILILLVGCTRVSLGKEGFEIDTSLKNNEKTNDSSTLKEVSDKVIGKLPSTKTDYETPSIVEDRIIDETEAVSFGDVI